MTRKIHLQSKGYSLLENLITISIISFLIPTILTAVIMNYRAKEKGAISYGSVEVAEVVFSELPSVWSEESNRLFPSTYPFPDFSESGEISFLFSKEGETRVVSDPEISQGEGIIEQSGYIATLKKDPQGSLSGSENFILEVSGPAGRAAERRQKFNFHRRYRSQ